MKKKFVILSLVLIFVNVFFYFAMPYLRDIREQGGMDAASLKNPSANLSRTVTVDISIESICKNMITDEPYADCNEENCDATCRREGCAFFSLRYQGSSFHDGSCHCICYEQNKIKRALSGQ